jgi:hypothetical protein
MHIPPSGRPSSSSARAEAGEGQWRHLELLTCCSERHLRRSAPRTLDNYQAVIFKPL